MNKEVKLALTPRQMRQLVVLHDLHKEVLQYRAGGKGYIPVHIKIRIGIACKEARQMKLDTRYSISFKAEGVRHIIWPRRLIQSLSGFL